MKVYLNPGHDQLHDSGAVNPNNGLREADVVAQVGELVKGSWLRGHDASE